MPIDGGEGITGVGSMSKNSSNHLCLVCTVLCIPITPQ